MRYQVKITAVWTDKYTIEATDQRRVRRGSNWTRPPCIVTNMDCPTDRYLPYNLPCPWPQCFIMRIAQFDPTPTPLPLVPPSPPPPNCENVFFKWGAHLITRNCSSLRGGGDETAWAKMGRYDFISCQLQRDTDLGVREGLLALTQRETDRQTETKRTRTRKLYFTKIVV